jgi:hypothetical protein
MDISSTTEPKSDQVNYDNFLSGPKTVTVAEVKKGTAEQPVEIHLVEFPGRPYRPGKSMRRVLVACWGPEASEYVGRRMTLYGDPTISFGGQAVGGIRISALSDITEQKSISLTVTRGKRAPFVVKPLTSTVTKTVDHSATIRDAKNRNELAVAWAAIQAAGASTDPALVALKDARKVELGVK